ncbi:MAG: choice-of-anchor L domain-containing protein [Byssovorax sp.]
MGLYAACSANAGSGVFGTTGSTGTGGSGSGTTASTSGAGGNGGDDIGFDGGPSGTGGGGLPTCNSGPNDDTDKDGFTIADGDCNDCDPNVNPGAIEVIAMPDADGGVPMPADEDCDGMVDNVLPPCDDGLIVEEPNPLGGARAVELCATGDAKHWGVLGAKWVMADGSPPPVGNLNFDLGHGILTGFGPNVNVQGGKRLLALSSGTARQPTDAGYQSVGGFDKGFTGNSPQGFPKESPACPGTITGQPHDPAALEVTVKVPTNAHGFSFDFNFFTYEWPNWICSQYNDFFVAILSPVPMGQQDGNISFDSQGNPVSVNNAFLDVCGCAGGPPCFAGGKNFPCSLGDAGLLGTGFQDQFSDHASTGWLVTKAPVEPGQQITIRWAVYDSGDGVLDSTTLVDNWQWIAESGTTVGTDVVPTPK